MQRKATTKYYDILEDKSLHAKQYMETKSCYNCSKCKRIENVVDNTTERLYLSDQVKTVHTLEYECECKGYDVSAILYCSAGDKQFLDHDCEHCTHGGTKIDVKCDPLKLYPRIRKKDAQSLRVIHTLITCTEKRHAHEGEYHRVNYTCPHFKPKRKHKRKMSDGKKHE